MRGNAGRIAATVVVVTVMVGACSPEPAPPPGPPAAAVQTPLPSTQEPPQPRLAADPARLADDLVSDERVLRDAAASEAALTSAARRQQVAYRTLARHPEWDPVVRERIPAQWLHNFDRNVEARRQLGAMGRGKSTLPAWRITAPPPADELLRYYRQAQAATGVGWNYLAAINFVETAFGRIAGTSTAGAQGPMQFLPSTFASYGGGGDIWSPHDSIMAAGRFLAAHGFAQDRDAALFRYNNSVNYVRAITAYAEVLASEPAAFGSYHRWDVYYLTTSGDVVLPVGYVSTELIPVQEYLKDNPQ